MASLKIYPLNLLFDTRFTLFTFLTKIIIFLKLILLLVSVSTLFKQELK